MKRVAIALLGLACVAMLVSPASAGSLLMENFSYLDGSLVAVSGGNWLMHSGTYTVPTDVQVVSGYAEGYMANSPDDNRLLSAARTNTDVTYSCMQVRIPDPGVTPGPSYFAHFKNSSTGFTARVFVGPKDATFTFGLSVGSGTVTYWPVALSYDTWYTVATSYDAATGAARLWVDPTDESSPSITDGGVYTGIVVVSYGLRQANVTGHNYKFDVDDLSVGATFMDACESPVPVQESTWGRIKSTYN
jgi:hypothetical protein